MPAKVDGREKTEQLESVDVANHAHVKQSVIELGLRGNSHSSAISRSIGKCGQQCGLIAPHDKRLRLLPLRHADTHGHGGKSHQRPRQAKRVASVATEPPGKLVGAAGGFRIESEAADTAKVASLYRGPSSFAEAPS